MKKLLSLAASLPIATISFLGLANSANAAVFNLGDQFNGFWGLQLNGHSPAGCPGTGNKAALGVNDQAGGCTAGFSAVDQRRGFNNGAIDFIFGPTLPTTGSNSFGTLNANNVLLNVSGSTTTDATIGNLATFLVNNGTGAFSNASFATTGNVRNADGLNLPNGFTTGANAPSDNAGLSFMDYTDTAGRRFVFTIDTVDNFTVGPGAIGFDYALTTTGRVRAYDPGNVLVDEAIVLITSTGQGLSEGPITGDGITAGSSLSFSATVIPATPESSSMLGLMAFAGVGLLSTLKKTKS